MQHVCRAPDMVAWRTCMHSARLHACTVLASGACVQRQKVNTMAGPGRRSSSFPALCPICQVGAEPKCGACEQRAAAAAAKGDDPGPPADWLQPRRGHPPAAEPGRGAAGAGVQPQGSIARTADLVPCPQPDCHGVSAGGGALRTPCCMHASKAARRSDGGECMHLQSA